MSVFQVVGSSEPQKRFDIGTFFKSVVSRQEEAWTGAEAFLCIICAAAACDGTVSPEESEEILATIHRSRLYKDSSGDELRRVNSVVAERLARRGDKALIEACAALPRELSLPAFAHAVDIVLSDGGFVQAEAQFLNKLIELLSVDESEAKRIAEVMDIKNRC
jgi:uncharacterized tellurite resistance protein B-like protein